MQRRLGHLLRLAKPFQAEKLLDIPVKNVLFLAGVPSIKVEITDRRFIN